MTTQENKHRKSTPSNSTSKKGYKRSESEKELSYNPEVTEHDKDILSQENIHGDGGDDQQLKDRKKKVDFAGDDLDVPGRKKARQSDKEGLPDEENKHFSQGGDDKNHLERDDSAL